MHFGFPFGISDESRGKWDGRKGRNWALKKRKGEKRGIILILWTDIVKIEPYVNRTNDKKGPLLRPAETERMSQT